MNEDVPARLQSLTKATSSSRTTDKARLFDSALSETMLYRVTERCQPSSAPNGPPPSQDCPAGAHFEHASGKSILQSSPFSAAPGLAVQAACSRLTVHAPIRSCTDAHELPVVRESTGRPGLVSPEGQLPRLLFLFCWCDRLAGSASPSPQPRRATRGSCTRPTAARECCAARVPAVSCVSTIECSADRLRRHPTRAR